MAGANVLAAPLIDVHGCDAPRQGEVAVRYRRVSHERSGDARCSG